jgi:hypothetical protein
MNAKILKTDGNAFPGEKNPEIKKSSAHSHHGCERDKSVKLRISHRLHFAFTGYYANVMDKALKFAIFML